MLGTGAALYSSNHAVTTELNLAPEDMSKIYKSVPYRRTLFRDRPTPSPGATYVSCLTSL